MEILVTSCGGIWKAAIKSAKHHIYRFVGNSQLSLEEMNTILSQTVAVIKSRPLYALSNDLPDLTYITPDHFLIKLDKYFLKFNNCFGNDGGLSI